MMLNNLVLEIRNTPIYVIKVLDNSGEIVGFKCPTCGNMDSIWDINGMSLNFCGICGQRISWEHLDIFGDK